MRHFLEGSQDGKRIMRDKREIEFRKLHGRSAVNQLRESYKDESSARKISLSDDDSTVNQYLKHSKKSNQPVFFLPADNGKPIAEHVKSALASRGSKLTAIDIQYFSDNELESVAQAIKTIPSNGFVSLVISIAVLSSKSAANLWSAISSHPIVAHIECIGDDTPTTADKVVEWVGLLAKSDANVSSFALNCCRLDALSDRALSTLLSPTMGIVELEIFENKTSDDSVRRLAKAVDVRNANAASQLKVHFSAGNLGEVITARDRSLLSSNSLCFREPGQLWAFQDQPVEDVFARENPFHENSAHEDSGHDDSSSVVGDPSSGDDAWGSEFEYSADESDVIVTNSSDDESGVENPQ